MKIKDTINLDAKISRFEQQNASVVQYYCKLMATLRTQVNYEV